MPLKLLRVVPTPGLSKKYAAVVQLPNGRQRTVRFGTASNYVSNLRKTFPKLWLRSLLLAKHKVVLAPPCAQLRAQPPPAAGRATPWPGPPCDRPPQSASVEEASRSA